MKYLSIILLLAAAGSAHAQVIFHADSIRDLRFTEKKFVDHEFAIGNAEILWTQHLASRDLITTFSISSVDGTWTDVQTDGEKTYNVVLNSKEGTITARRENGTYRIRIHYDGLSPFDLLFHVDTVE